MPISTDELMKNIQLTLDLDALKAENEDAFLDEKPCEYLNALMEARGLEPAAVSAASGLDASYCYRIFAGARTPGRNALIRLLLSMKLGAPEAQHALRLYRMARLDPRVYRDAAILFALFKGYSPSETTELLFELGEAEL